MNELSIKETTKKEIQEVSIEKKRTGLLTQRMHQFIIIGILHLVYIIFESMNAFAISGFAYSWPSALIYSLICFFTIFSIWREWESAKYLVPIPFISLIVVGTILEFPEMITALFVLYCIFYFTMTFIKKDTGVSILTICFSGLSFLLLTAFMRFDQGFVKVNFEFNVVSCILLILVVAASLTVFFNKKSFGLLIAYNATFIILGSLLPFIKPEGANSNLFTLFCAISVLIVGIVTFTKFLRSDEQEMINLIPLVIIEQIGIIILSYSYTMNFNWLGGISNVMIIDYAIFMPLVLFVSITLAVRYFPVHKDPTRKSDLDKIDLTIIGTFLSFIVASMAMAGWIYGNFNLIKALVLSIIFFGITIPLSLKYSASVSLISTYVFLGLVLKFVALVSSDIVLISLMAFSSALILFAIINELYIMGEPLTSSMIISGSMLLMVCSFVYFNYIEIWTSLIWAGLGLYLFVIGLLFNKIYLRRTGLIVLLVDIVYTIVYLSIGVENRVLLGVGFMVLGVVLFICIWLFRWSEQKMKREKETAETESEEIIETV